MLDFVRALSFGSMVPYALWRLQKRQGAVELATRSGIRFQLRPPSEGNGDFGIAYEIFVLDFYGGNPQTPVRHVVDLGMNVGFSVLHWLGTYPGCRVVAYEPHPRHFEQARRNIERNGWLDRVELHQAAAGSHARAITLSDEGSSSTIQAPGHNGLSVQVEDVFPVLQGRRVDILKIDIEGGEYEILEDPRFDTLDIGAIVMEWHGRRDGEADGQWCESRLRGLGYAIEDIFRTPTHGMFFARKAASPG